MGEKKHTDRRIMLPDGFDKFVSERWPEGVATDCTKLANDADCLELNLPEPEWCESCRNYNRLAGEYDGPDGRYFKATQEARRG